MPGSLIARTDLGVQSEASATSMYPMMRRWALGVTDTGAKLGRVGIASEAKKRRCNQLVLQFNPGNRG